MSCLNEGIQSSPTERDIYVLLGQSNLSGRARICSSESESFLNLLNNFPSNSVEIFTRNNDNEENDKYTWKPFTEPIHYHNERIEKKMNVGIGPSIYMLEKMMSNNIENCSSLKGLLPCCIGGSNLSSWDISNEDDEYSSQKKIHPHPHLKAIL